MKQRVFLAVGTACVVLVGVVIWQRNTTGDKPVTAPGREVRTGMKPAETRVATDHPNQAPPSDAAKTPAGEAPESSAQAVILATIEEASTTYDAKELPRIEPYLLHSDPQVREAAMKGMIVLGDAAAGPMLRKASQSAPTPQEAVALLEAADYIELPSATGFLNSVTAKKVRGPAGQPPPPSKPKSR